jgi:two-component system nitrate/nitrite response regulator NarL
LGVALVAQHRVLVVANDLLTRRGLAALLTEATGADVVGVSAGGDNLAGDLVVYDPDVIVYDLGWDPTTAVPGFAEFVEYGVPVVALIPDEDSAREVVGELKAVGAFAVLLRESEPDLLASAIAGAGAGLIVIDPEVRDAIIPATNPSQVILTESLTPRESEVLQLVARGLTNKAIAERLDITDHTVKFHVNAIMGKLAAQSRTDAVVKATRLGLIVL